MSAAASRGDLSVPIVTTSGLGITNMPRARRILDRDYACVVKIKNKE
jgi:hypothetical protein